MTMDSAICERSYNEPCSVPAGVYGITFDTDNADAEYACCGGGYVEVYAGGGIDLIDQWEEFCTENDEDPSSVVCVSLEEDDAELFEEYLERTGATVYKATNTWRVVEDGAEVAYHNWYEMLKDMFRQCKDMRG